MKGWFLISIDNRSPGEVCSDLHICVDILKNKDSKLLCYPYAYINTERDRLDHLYVR